MSYTARQLAAGAEHNWRPIEGDFARRYGSDSDDIVDMAEFQGMSAFALRDGEVFHTYSAYARGVDVLWNIYQWLDRALLGRNETRAWQARHDEY